MADGTTTLSALSSTDAPYLNYNSYVEHTFRTYS